MGLGSINTYLRALGMTEMPYASQNTNLLFDLHGSGAEYAINFGILQNILAQDSRTNNATAVCSANLQFSVPADTQSFNAQVSAAVTAAQGRTMCSLLQTMSTPGLYPPLSPTCIGNVLHKHMFRANEAATGTC